MRWADFAAAAPSLAEGGQRRLASGVALLGTIRRDGSPRISPVEPVFAAGQLMFGLMRSAKDRDLERDARCVLHSSVSDPNGSEGEFKLYGRAVLIEDRSLRDAGEGWWKSYPPEQSNVYWLDITSAALLEWDFAAMSKSVAYWSSERGLTTTSQTYP